LGHVTGFKQKRRECKYCEKQINDSLRAARTHFRNCKLVTSEQKKNYFGNSYEEDDDMSIDIPDIPASAASISISTLVASTSSPSTSALITSTSSISNEK
ncbi:25423_t:CDS:1, partial [Gigaspora rosea]